VRRDRGRGRVGVPGLAAIVPVTILVFPLLDAVIPIAITVFLGDDVPTAVLGLSVRQRGLFLRGGGGVGVRGPWRLRDK
jgi:hypothetical protein